MACIVDVSLDLVSCSYCCCPFLYLPVIVWKHKLEQSVLWIFFIKLINNNFYTYNFSINVVLKLLLFKLL